MKQLKKQMLVLIGIPFLLLATKVHAQQSTALQDFTAIKANGNCSIELYQADRNSIYVDDNEKAKATNLKIYVENGTLHIDNSADKVSNIRVYIKVYFKNLDALDLGGAIEVTGKDIIQTSHMQIKSSGATHLNIKMVTEELKVTADGASDLTLAGKSTSLNVDVSGASSVRAAELMAQTVTVSAEGGSSVSVHATEKLDVKADGASSVRYAGGPKCRSIKTSGVASVKKAI